MKNIRKSKAKNDVVMWRGIGILSGKSIVLEAWSDGDDALARYDDYPRGYRLVLVTARLERVTKQQCRGHKLGLVRRPLPKAK